MQKIKGWICLDIDGTITADPHNIPQKVTEYFLFLYQQGWRFVFITGRMFSFAKHTLRSITFPYLLSVQNGADLLQMPEQTLIRQCYLPGRSLVLLEELYANLPEDYLIYSGWEKGDFCYYRIEKFSPLYLKHLKKIQALSSIPWQNGKKIADLKKDMFPLIKCFGNKEDMLALEHKIHSFKDFNASCIKDPLSKEGIYMTLITDKSASKGNALRYLKNVLAEKMVFIAAGDDRNDLSLLQAADVAIAMQDAPEELIAIAQIIAKPADQLGIIDALQCAVKKTEGNNG